MTRPVKCRPRNEHKTWLTKEQALQKSRDYGLKAYSCYDHWHVGHKGPKK